MRYSSIFSLVVLVILFMICIVWIDAADRNATFDKSLAIRNRYANIVALPDLSITTAARYLRHYSLTDLSTPFQDYPCSQEHFPASFAYSPPDFKNMPGRIKTLSKP